MSNTIKTIREKSKNQIIARIKTLISAAQIFVKSIRAKFLVFLYKTRSRWLLTISIWDLNSRNIIRITIIIIGLTLSFLTYFYFPVFENYSALSNGYFAIGSMMGGIIAIVYSLTNFLQQSVNELQSSSFYEKYIHDKRDQQIYRYLATITILFLFIGFLTSGTTTYLAWIKLFTATAISLITLALILIDFLHQSTSQKVNPTNAIKYLENECSNLLKTIKIDAEHFIKVISANSNYSNEEITKFVYGSAEKTNFKYLFDNLQGMIEIATQLSEKQKDFQTNQAIDSVARILYQYLQLRKGNSSKELAKDGLLTFNSDSQELFMNFFEDFNRFAKRLLIAQKETSMRCVIKTYESLVLESLKLSYGKNDLLGDNPISFQIFHYFKTLISEILVSNNLESIYQAEVSLNNISIQTVGYRDQLLAPNVIESLEEIIQWGITHEQQIIVQTVFKTIVFTLNASLFVPISTAKSNIADFLKLFFKYTDFIQQVKRGSAYHSMFIYIFNMWLINSVYTSIAKNALKSEQVLENALTFYEELAFSLRSYVRETTDIYSDILSLVGKYLIQLIQLLFLVRSNIKKPDYISNIDRLINDYSSLSSWFIIPKEKFSNIEAYFQLTTFIAIKLIIDNHSEDTIMKSVKTLTYMIEKHLHAADLHTDEPKSAIYLSYIGVLTHNKYNSVFEFIKSFLQKHDSEYKIKYKDFIDKKYLDGLEIVSKVWNWRDELSTSSPHYNDNILPMLKKVVLPSDIDNFVKDIWNMSAGPSITNTI